MKKLFMFLMLLFLTASLISCGSSDSSSENSPAADTKSVELTVFAAASMTETLDQIIELYRSVSPHVTIVPSYASSGDLLRQIQEGAPCDLFISAAPKQIDALDEANLLLPETRLDLLENKVTLAVPDSNPAGVTSFGHLADLLKNGTVFLAIGNSDVPVGQYTLKIFDYYNIDENEVASKLTYGSNVKEVTTQVKESMVDCGIIYGTDAFSAELTVIDTATTEMCGQVLYPAAVLRESQHPDEAAAFLAYLQSDDARAIFESVGFSPLP